MPSATMSRAAAESRSSSAMYSASYVADQLSRFVEGREDVRPARTRCQQLVLLIDERLGLCQVEKDGVVNDEAHRLSLR